METVSATWTPRSGTAPDWAQYYDEVVDRHGPLLTEAVGRRLTGVWTPTSGLLGRRFTRAWGSHAPLLFVFEGLQLEFSFHINAHSVTRADVDVAASADRRGDPEGWRALGDRPGDPADLVSLAGQRLWAVDVLEADCDRCDFGFAFSRGYLALTTMCCCTLVLSCGPPQRRRLRLAQTGPTREGHPPRAVSAPRGRPAWPPSGYDPSQV